jgi:ATP/maltotriose-dependent transcriptional regulator MalT/DNA-binding SARP family transcriptional activator
MPEYPIQISKVQPPPLRDQTLARDRLLEWLAVKIHDRAVLITAEAGYGKTTLLADFSRRTRLRTLWFRLDRGDRDWVGFIAHLVAAVRIHIPAFGPVTDSLLRETATASPPRDAVLDAFLRELGDLPPDPTVLIFDDFHLVDDSPDIRHIAKELLARAPERVSFVFASRRVPPIRLARLRALGEIAELRTDDLRFDATETERLFRETFEMRLEPGLIAELSRRTEGWAASLQLVRTALHDRDPAQVRQFIKSLSGAEGHLYDYLAEEVIGDLPAGLQQFLMRTSILETIDLVLGPVAAEVPVATARELIDNGEQLGLFGRRGPHTRHQVRAHPLVRDFLQARLLRSIGPGGVAEIHRRSARAAEPIDWRIAGHHYLAAGDEDDARRVLAASIETILATGAYVAAQVLVSSLTEGQAPGSVALVIASRLAQQRGDSRVGLNLAEKARDLEPASTAVLLNLITAKTLAGDVAGALEVGRILEESATSDLANIGRVYQRLMETSLIGSIDLAVAELEDLAESLRARSELHFLGVDLLNQAYVRMSMGNPAESLRCSEEAISLLESTSKGIELVSAEFARATALAHLGELDEARREVARAIAIAPRGQAIETAIEVGGLETLLGDAYRAWQVLDPVDELITSDSDTGEQALLVRSLLRLRVGDTAGADSDIRQFRHGEPRTALAFEVRRQLARALHQLLTGDSTASSSAASARAIASRQGAWLWERYAAVLEAFSAGGGVPSEVTIRVGREDPTVLSMAAEAVLLRLPELSPEAQGFVLTEAARRPWRWRESARRRLETAHRSEVLPIAGLLEQIGEPEDVKRLRVLSKGLRDARASNLGRDLARRLAPRVMVEDLGRVHVIVGSRTVDGSDVRRKVLALLCLLVSKTRFSSTREEVLESLWPELDPASALNSLNQTVYFLRRVFEPAYREDLSPGYVLQDGETIWLDGELVEARSRRCRDMIKSMSPELAPAEAAALAEEYRGRFALDFAYEEWAAPYRDSLHAAYLRIVEQAVRMDIDSGHFARGTLLAERAAEVEPDSEDLQLALVRLYRMSGAHAAAAEQYSHYAQTLRDLGVDPPPFADV